MVHLKDPLLLLDKSSLCIGGSGYFLQSSELSSTVVLLTEGLLFITHTGSKIWINIFSVCKKIAFDIMTFI